MASSIPPAPAQKPFLDGQFLVAMPGMPDERFARSVIYVCAHSQDGAMGLVINQAAREISFPQLLVHLDVIAAGDAPSLPVEAGAIKVLRGGPVETERGFVLHSSDFSIGNATLPINGGICLTANIDILRAIAKGQGPKKALLALGYSNWAPGQLDMEMQHNGWLNCPADPAMIFEAALDTIYDRVLREIGIDPAMLSSDAGHA